MEQIMQVKQLCKKKIHNCKDYVETDVKMCDPILSENTKAKSKCTILKNKLIYSSSSHSKKNSHSQSHKTKKIQLKVINMPNLGINLHRYLGNKANFKNPQTFVDINNSIIQLYQKFILPLNKNNFYHNDIKALNIMLDNTGNYRLIDFGLSNQIIFSFLFDFNKPFNYILLTDYFLDQIDHLKKQGSLQYDSVKQLILYYLELIKAKQDSNYIYTKEILEFMFPNQVGKNDEINPVLVDSLVHFAMKYKSRDKTKQIYIHNLDITGVALIYPDIICVMSMKKHLSMKLFHGIVAFYTKYVLHAYDKINHDEFIQDLNNLNLLVV